MVVSESFVRDFFRILVWFPFRWFLNLLPVPACFFLFRRLGDLNYWVDRKKRDLIKNNLDSAFSGRHDTSALNHNVRRIMQMHYMDRMLVFVFPKLSRNNVGKYIEIKGIEILDEALRANRGCILVHAHFGPAQLSLCALGYKGYPTNQLGLRSAENTSYIGRKVVLNTRLKIEENKIPAKMLYVNQFMRQVFRALKNNEVLMMTGDGIGGKKFRGKYITANFLGRRMQFPVGWVSLAKKTSAAVIPLTLYEVGKSKYRMVLNPPIFLSHDDDQELSTMMGDLNQFIHILERDIEAQPYMWHFWDEFHVGNLLVS